jgi:hypothetical protein
MRERHSSFSIRPKRSWTASLSEEASFMTSPSKTTSRSANKKKKTFVNVSLAQYLLHYKGRLLAAMAFKTLAGSGCEDLEVRGF